MAKGGDEKASRSTPDVFISYASLDSAVAEAACEGLEKAGVTCWIAPRDVTPGAFYGDEIVHAIDAAKAIVLILSQNAATSPHVLREVERAASKRHPVISLRIDKAPLPAGLEYFLNTSQWLDASPGDAVRALPKLVSAVQLAIQASTVTSTGVPTAQAPAPAVSARSRKRMTLVVASVVILALVGLAAERLWRSSHRAAATPAIPVVPAPVAVTAAPPIPEKSVAVLPFVDMSETKDQEYFADGMAEEILDLLAKIPGLRVPARTSSFYFKGKSEDIPTIARRLMVAHVMEGSVRKSGNHLRITVQLVKADTGYHLWSETYDRTLDDIFKVQDEIAAEVVKALKLSLNANGAPRAVATRNTQAHALILQADFLLGRDTHDDVVRAIGYLQQAIHLDPQSAVGWADLSGALTLEWLYGSLPEGRTWQQQREQALRAAERAVAIDPQLGDAHDALAGVRYWFDWDWGAAQVELERARTLGTEDRVLAGLLAELRGQLKDAMRLWEQASADDPLNFTAYMYGSLAHCAVGQFAEALALSDKMVELSPASSRLRAVRAQVLLDLGQSDAALAVAGSETDPGYRAYALVRTAIVSGRTTDADSALSAFEQTYAADWAYEIAELQALRGDTDQAFAWMERAHGQHDPALIGVLSVNVDPDMKSLHKEPRWVAFLRKMNLPE